MNTHPCSHCGSSRSALQQEAGPKGRVCYDERGCQRRAEKLDPPYGACQECPEKGIVRYTGSGIRLVFCAIHDSEFRTETAEQRKMLGLAE